MAEYNKKWADLFPATIGNQTRPSAGVDNTLQYETDKFPQHIANDPVRYDKMNAVVSQAMSNDERLNEKINKTSDDLAAHNKYPKAHATGISGNAATATKLQTARTLSLTGKAAGSATFDGSANAAINVTSVNADTASKLSTARKINITGNATGAAAFDGSGDININTTVNESKHAAAADTIKSSAATETSAVARPVWLSWEGDNTKQVVSPNLTYTCSTKTLTAANFAGHLAGNADTATNADKVDGYHENSFLRYRGTAAVTGEDTLWDQIGIKEYDDKLPKGVSGTYSYGAAVSLPGGGTRLDIWYNHQCSANGDGLWYRSGWETEQKPWARLLDSNNYTNWAPTKTGAGASGTWGINISGNAKTATTASSVPWAGITGKPGTYPPSAHNHDSAYPSVTGTRASGTWGISISGNAASATNADTVDGYHASDLLGKIYPVGSIYMSMSATNPHDLFGVGTWARISQGRMLLGADDSTYKAGATGGEATHTLTANEMPRHDHYSTTSWANLQGHFGSGDSTAYFYRNDTDGICSNSGGTTKNGYGAGGDWNDRYSRIKINASHNHTIQSDGGSQPHNNMSPYLVCYIWQRTA